MIKKFCDICGEEISKDTLNDYYICLNSINEDSWSLDICEECESKLKRLSVVSKLKELV